MAVNFNDPDCGFFQREVVDFINKQLLRGGVRPYFYRMQMCESWGEMEEKLRDILTDSAISRAIKEACAWGTLALAVRFARRQKRDDREKVKKLQDQLEEQKVFSNALVGMVNRLRDKQKREKEIAQLQLQQNLTILRRVEEERNLLRNALLRVLRSQFQKQERTEELEKGKETQTLGTLAFAPDAVSYWTREGATQGAGPGTAATPMTAAIGGEAKGQKVISIWGNDQEVPVFPCSEILRAWTQAGQLLPFSLSESSYSFLPTYSLPGAATKAAAVPLVKNSLTSWKGKHLHTRKFLPERFKQEAGICHSAKDTIRRKVGDWDCDQCSRINFSWRKMCFKCKKSRYTEESGGSARN
ncbi:testis-expressed protein 13A-like [Equus przewalskii]|uniref:RanBP2-type domain-containing protein n=2 Tax=Equus TaxID=9789 RepID=A0A9L0T5E7_HORSE|nr:testis-expressed protein 13A-like [Equus caballus]